MRSVFPEKLRNLLFSRPAPFVSIATSDLKGQPNAALKFLLKSGQNDVYFVDLPYGQTYENLKKNPRMSFSFYDPETLRCYKVYGTAEIIEKGPIRDAAAKEIDARLKDITVNRIIEGLQRGRSHKAFLIDMPKTYIVVKMSVEKIFEYGVEDPKAQLL